MNHPDPEDWALYVSNETAPGQTREFAAHLRECSSCAAEVAALQRSARRLAHWQFPKANRSHQHAFAPMVKWGIAAGLVLGVGFALGRFSTPPAHDLAKMRVAIEESLEASLSEDLHKALDEAHAQSEEALSATEARLGKASDEQMTRVVRNVLAAVSGIREEDRTATSALIEEVRQQHEKEIRRVRADLETVATQADDQLRFAHFQLRQLTAGIENTK
jgi:anti-sigma factor RsiW